MSGLDIHAWEQAIGQATTSHELFLQWQLALTHLRQANPQGEVSLTHRHSQLADALVRKLAESYPSTTLVVAVDQYGRCQLLPYAPITLLLIAPNTEHSTLAKQVKLATMAEPRMSYVITDSKSLLQQSQHDARLFSQLATARFLAGSHKEWFVFQQALSEHPWDPNALFVALQQNKPKLYTSTPDLRECYGGLAHLQQTFLLSQLAPPHSHPPYGAERLAGEESLLRLCWQLQCQTQANTYELDNRQASALASALQHEPRFTLSTLLRHVYLLTLENTRWCLLEQQFLLEALPSEQRPTHLVNRRFILQKGNLDIINPVVLQRWPFAMLEMFTLPAEEPRIQGFSHQSLALTHRNRALLTKATQEQRYWFLRLLDRSQDLFTALLTLHQLGALEYHIPELGFITGKLAYGSELRYPMDLQALVLIKNLQALRQEVQPSEPSGLAYTLSYHIPKPSLLYVAALFHHLYRQRSHSIEAAQEFCVRHGLPSWESDVVCWLIENQDLMLNTSEKQDLNQPQNIYAFAQYVKNLLRLDYLYLLSIGKLRTQATEPEEHWPIQRLNLLYHACKKALRRGLNNPVANTSWADETRQQAAKLLAQQAASGFAVQHLWAQIGDEYFLRETPADIAWHTQAILRHRHQEGPLVLLREQLNAPQRGTQVFIYTKDSDYLFAATVQILEQLGLNIVAANIITSAHGFSLDTYTVVDNHKNAITDTATLSHIQQTLYDKLSQPDTFYAELQPLSPTSHHQQTQIQLASSADGFYTVVAIQTLDQPGLLTRIARIFTEFECNLHHARIATYGERVEDIFHISDNRGLPLSEAQQSAALQNALLMALG